jgi:hypothetical protein
MYNIKVIQENTKSKKIKETTIGDIDRYVIIDGYISLYEKFEEIPKNGFDLANRCDNSYDCNMDYERRWKNN